jgi:hypothetical protein
MNVLCQEFECSTCYSKKNWLWKFVSAFVQNKRGNVLFKGGVLKQHFFIKFMSLIIYDVAWKIFKISIKISSCWNITCCNS